MTRLEFAATGVAILLFASCTDRPYCRLAYGGAAQAGVFPPGSELGTQDYTALIEMSRVRRDGFAKYGEKAFLIRVTDRQGEIVLVQDCIKLKAGEFKLDFEWEKASDLTLILDYEDEVGTSKTLKRRYALDIPD